MNASAMHASDRATVKSNRSTVIANNCPRTHRADIAETRFIQVHSVSALRSPNRSRYSVRFTGEATRLGIFLIKCLLPRILHSFLILSGLSWLLELPRRVSDLQRELSLQHRQRQTRSHEEMSKAVRAGEITSDLIWKFRGKSPRTPMLRCARTWSPSDKKASPKHLLVFSEL